MISFLKICNTLSEMGQYLKVCKTGNYYVECICYNMYQQNNELSMYVVTIRINY